MAQISLLYPDNSSQKTRETTPQAINDLSIDYIVESLTNDIYEKNSIKNILTNITCDIDVINYRADVFEDILNFPNLREGLVELLKKLLAEQISMYQRLNLVKSEKFSEIMKRVMNGYLNGMITNEEVIQELLNLAKQIQAP